MYENIPLIKLSGSPKQTLMIVGEGLVAKKSPEEGDKIREDNGCCMNVIKIHIDKYCTSIGKE